MHAVWGGSVAARDARVVSQAVRRAVPGSKPAQQGGSDWDHLMAAAAAAPPGCHGVMFLPHMSAAGCPVVDQRSLGAFVGLSSPADRRPTCSGRSSRGSTTSSATSSRRWSRAWARRCERFVAVGGATRNAFWMQNKADVIGRPIEVPDVEEATPLGAAILAGIGVGLYRDDGRMRGAASRGRLPRGRERSSPTRSSPASTPAGSRSIGSFTRHSARSAISFSTGLTEQRGLVHFSAGRLCGDGSKMDLSPSAPHFSVDGDGGRSGRAVWRRARTLRWPRPR